MAGMWGWGGSWGSYGEQWWSPGPAYPRPVKVTRRMHQASRQRLRALGKWDPSKQTLEERKESIRQQMWDFTPVRSTSGAVQVDINLQLFVVNENMQPEDLWDSDDFDTKLGCWKSEAQWHHEYYGYPHAEMLKGFKGGKGGKGKGSPIKKAAPKLVSKPAKIQPKAARKSPAPPGVSKHGHLHPPSAPSRAMIQAAVKGARTTATSSSSSSQMVRVKAATTVAAMVAMKAQIAAAKAKQAKPAATAPAGVQPAQVTTVAAQLVALGAKHDKASRDSPVRKAEAKAPSSPGSASASPPSSASHGKSPSQEKEINKVPFNRCDSDALKQKLFALRLGVVDTLASSSPFAEVASVSTTEGKFIAKCSKGHQLQVSMTDCAGWRCSTCKQRFDQGVQIYGCRQCNYDECGDCARKRAATRPKRSASPANASARPASASAPPAKKAKQSPSASGSSSSAPSPTASRSPSSSAPRAPKDARGTQTKQRAPAVAAPAAATRTRKPSPSPASRTSSPSRSMTPRSSSPSHFCAGRGGRRRVEQTATSSNAKQSRKASPPRASRKKARPTRDQTKSSDEGSCEDASPRRSPPVKRSDVKLTPAAVASRTSGPPAASRSRCHSPSPRQTHSSSKRRSRTVDASPRRSPPSRPLRAGGDLLRQVLRGAAQQNAAQAQASTKRTTAPKPTPQRKTSPSDDLLRRVLRGHARQSSGGARR